jgi:hypothetical protein
MLFNMNALISSPLKNTFHNPDAVPPFVRVNGNKAPRSSMDQDVVTSSLTKDKNKQSKNVTDHLRYLGPSTSGSSPAVEKILFPDNEGLLNQVLHQVTLLNTKVDFLTEKSTKLEEDFKGLKADMEEVKTSSKDNKERVDELCSTVSDITIDVQRLGAAIVAIQNTQAEMKKDHDQPRGQPRNMHHTQNQQQQQHQQQQPQQDSGGEGGRRWENPSVRTRGGAQSSTRPQVRVMGRQAPAYWKKSSVMGFRVPIGREVKGEIDTNKACHERGKKIVKEVAALCGIEMNEVSCDTWPQKDVKPGEKLETMTIRLGLPDKDAAYTVFMKRDMIEERSETLKGVFLKEDLNEADMNLKRGRIAFYDKCKEAAKGKAHIRFLGAKIWWNDSYVLSRDAEGKQFKSELGEWREVKDYENVPKWRDDEWGVQEGPVESMAVDSAEGGEEKGPDKDVAEEQSVSK